MVFPARNEQHFDYRVHNTTWEPIDFDGIKLMMRPSPSRAKALGEKRGSVGATRRRDRKRDSERGLRNRLSRIDTSCSMLKLLV